MHGLWRTRDAGELPGPSLPEKPGLINELKTNHPTPSPPIPMNANPTPQARPLQAAALLLAATLAAGAAQPPGFTTAVQPYALSLSPEYVLKPILSAGDQVPHSTDAAKQFKMIGVPDGLGAARLEGGIALFMNHELAGTAISEPVVGEPFYRGSLVSRLTLNHRGEVLSGSVAYNAVVDTARGIELPPARVDNTTPGFWRFCSATLAGSEEGFDRPIYLLGEENRSPSTFDGRGGLAVAVVDGKLHTLPHLGRFEHENLPVKRHTHNQTVLVLMEDNGVLFNSQLYLYVGRKDHRPGADPLARNGLTGGKLYVFASTTPGVANEADFQSGTIEGKWVELPDVSGLSDSELETLSQSVGAFGMTKSEDGAWSRRDENEFFFNSTGDGANAPAVVGNHFGRTYRLQFNEEDVTGPCLLSLLYNADKIYAAGGDIALTPDNIDTSERYVMVCEDGTGFSRNAMAARGRTGLIWRYDLENNYAATPIVTLATAGRDGRTVGSGVVSKITK